MHTNTQSSQPLRLLAIDDEPHCADLIARLARKCGFDARGLGETRSLAQVLLEWKPDVITLDLVMPRADGGDVLTALKVMAYQGRVLIVSGQAKPVLEAARKQAELGRLKVAGYMQKPVDLKAMRDILEALHGQLTGAGMAAKLAG
jgi:DNA-binding NtrC family response regulator